MRPALYQPSAAAVGRMQICFICIETWPRPQCLPSHSIPPPTTLPTLLWRVLRPWIYIYIPHMLSDSRPPAAKHSLPCEGCQFVYMLMLLFPSRPPASSGRPLTIPLCSKVTRRSVVTLPDFTHTSASGFSSNLLFFFIFSPSFLVHYVYFWKWKRGRMSIGTEDALLNPRLDYQPDPVAPQLAGAPKG